MAQYFEIHPSNPQLRLVRQAATIIREGGLVAYPTDSSYALGCHLDDKRAVDRIRQIRKHDRHHNFTLVAANVKQVSQFAKIETSSLGCSNHLHRAHIRLFLKRSVLCLIG